MLKIVLLSCVIWCTAVIVAVQGAGSSNGTSPGTSTVPGTKTGSGTNTGSGSGTSPGTGSVTSTGTKSGPVDVDEFVHPHYTYSCEEDKSIIVRGISDGGIVTIIGNACNTFPKNVTNQQIRIPSTCLQNSTNAKIVKLSIWDKLHDGSNTPPTVTNLVGGQRSHLFTITCKEISSSGVARVAEKQMHLKDSEVKDDEIFQVDNVKMTFRKTREKNSEQLSSIYIGDEFYMFLTYSGTSDYVVMPQTCSAIAGNNVDLSVRKSSSTPQILLWNYKTCLSTEATTQAVMENFTFDDTNRVTKAKMYGFHFTQNSDISIICDVTVCGKFNGGCQKPIGAGCPTSARRRRYAQNRYASLKISDENHYSNEESMVKRSAKRQKSTTVGNTIRVYDTKYMSDVGVQNSALLPMYMIFILVKLVI